jgi:lipopolysaccharide transport system permease protein
MAKPRGPDAGQASLRENRKPKRRRRRPAQFIERTKSHASADRPGGDQAGADAVAVSGGGNGASSRPLRIIEPPAPGIRRTLGAYWHYRAAFPFFVRRFLRKRYGRTFLGMIWLFLPVLMPLFMGAIVFGGILGVSIPGVPYFLFFVVASAAWHLFSQTAYFATRSLEISRSELRRVYVPRLIPLTASMTLPVFTFLIYVGITVIAVAYYAWADGETYLSIGPTTLLVPVALTALVVLGQACGLWFSPLAARARDVRRLAGYVLGMWYFLTPVIYPIEEIPEGWQFLASLNPVTAPIELVKTGILGVGDVTTTGVISYFAALAVVGLGGLMVFLPKERRDVVHY